MFNTIRRNALQLDLDLLQSDKTRKGSKKMKIKWLSGDLILMVCGEYIQTPSRHLFFFEFAAGFLNASFKFGFSLLFFQSVFLCRYK
jgi:hypothetical protein